MSKSRSFSIYLLKKERNAKNSLKAGHALQKGVHATKLPPGGELFLLNSSPREPWWRSYFGVSENLTQVAKGALIFLPAGGRCFVLSFGHAYHKLDDTAYEYDFGLKVTLNSVDPELLKSTDVVDPGSAQRRRTQVPVNSDLTYFDFDRDSTILKSLTGKVKEEHKKFFKYATGSSSLKISSSATPNELVELCEKLLELYSSEEYLQTFPGIQNVVPVRDPVLIDALNEQLLQAIKERDVETVNLAVPDLINYSDNVYATFTGCGGGELYEDVYTELYYKYLKENNQKLEALTIENLKNHKLKIVDQEEPTKSIAYSILKCIVYDTTLSGNGTDESGTYHISEGNWFGVEDDYIKKLANFLDACCEEIELPDYSQENEGAYNKAVAVDTDDYLCLDKKNIAPDRQSQIEPCDILGTYNETAAFYHIKISTLSNRLSHLFNQGTNSVELLRLESEAREKLAKLVADSELTMKRKEEITSLLDEQQYSVKFGIITHKEKGKKSANLPLFSRISLKRNLETLQMMKIPAAYGFIADTSPKKVGKNKKGKKKPNL